MNHCGSIIISTIRVPPKTGNPNEGSGVVPGIEAADTRRAFGCAPENPVRKRLGWSGFRFVPYFESMEIYIILVQRVGCLTTIRGGQVGAGLSIAG